MTADAVECKLMVTDGTSSNVTAAKPGMADMNVLMYYYPPPPILTAHYWIGN